MEKIRGPKLFVVPLELREANEFVAQYHRHHTPLGFHRFSLGSMTEDGVLHSVAIVGKPTARMAGNQRDVLEVSRLASDGTMNACSVLYAASARAGASLGYLKIITYTLPEEGGASLRASGWVEEGQAGGGSWSRPSRPREDKAPTSIKTRWAKELSARPALVLPDLEADAHPQMFSTVS